MTVATSTWLDLYAEPKRVGQAVAQIVGRCHICGFEVTEPLEWSVAGIVHKDEADQTICHGITP